MTGKEKWNWNDLAFNCGGYVARQTEVLFSKEKEKELVKRKKVFDRGVEVIDGTEGTNCRVQMITDLDELAKVCTPAIQELLITLKGAVHNQKKRLSKHSRKEKKKMLQQELAKLRKLMVDEINVLSAEIESHKNARKLEKSKLKEMQDELTQAMKDLKETRKPRRIKRSEDLICLRLIRQWTYIRAPPAFYGSSQRGKERESLQRIGKAYNIEIENRQQPLPNRAA